MKWFAFLSLIISSLTAFAEYDASAYLEQGRLIEGRVCFNECRPKKGFLGLGNEKDGPARNSCIPCLVRYPQIYKVKNQFIPSGSSSIQVPEANNQVIQENQLCYNECKPKKEFLGLAGKTKSGTERNSCVSCLGAYPEVYTIQKGLDVSAENTPFICPEANKAVIGPKDDCYKECRPKRSFLGIVGPERSGLERQSCVSCLVNHKDKYQVSVTTRQDHQCTIADDQQTVYCEINGKTYKLDSSVNVSDRSIAREDVGGTTTGVQSGSQSGSGSGSSAGSAAGAGGGGSSSGSSSGSGSGSSQQ